MEASACSSRVDLPTPGSPPSTVTDPATSPPPSTRSSSGSPVGTGSVASPTASAIGMGTDRGASEGNPPTERADSDATGSSDSVPEDSHAEHHPVHFGASAPHSEQR